MSLVFYPSRSSAPVVQKMANICLSTPDNSAVLSLSVPDHPATIRGAIIRFAAEHGLSPSMVDCVTLSVRPRIREVA